MRTCVWGCGRPPLKWLMEVEVATWWWWWRSCADGRSFVLILVRLGGGVVLRRHLALDVWLGGGHRRRVGGGGVACRTEPTEVVAFGGQRCQLLPDLIGATLAPPGSSGWKKVDGTG